MTISEAYGRLNLRQDILPVGVSNRPGRALQASFITIHNTDNEDAGADANAHAKYMRGEDARQRKVSWHFTIDDQRAIKHLPLSEQGFHAGSRDGNQSSIGIEICENAGSDQAAANDRAALLTAVILFTMQMPVERVVPHQHWSGKFCPHLLLANNRKGWNAFVKQVEAYVAALNKGDETIRTSAVFEVSDVVAVSKIPTAFKELKDGAPSNPTANLKVNGKSYVLNARPDVPDFRDQMYIATLTQVPPSMPLSVYQKVKVPILDQGQEGACTGFGLATVANYLLRKLSSTSTAQVSPRMLYEMAKRYDEWPGEDYSGSSARGAMKGWNKHGVCSEADWPYDSNNVNGSLNEVRARLAAQNPQGAYFRVNHKDLVGMHTALAEVGILYATSSVHKGWTEVGADGIIKFDPVSIGGHAFAIVGYDEKGFWIQNSWSATWGKKGFGHISYDDWLISGTDVWVARLGVPIQFSSSLGPVVASNFSSVASKTYSYLEVRPHIVSLGNDGLLRSTGTFANDSMVLAEIIQKKIPETMVNWKRKRILLYAHGGLVPEDTVVNQIALYREEMLKREVYPLAFVWNSDLVSTLRNILEDATRRTPAGNIFGDALDWLQDRADDAIEFLARKPGAMAWDEMKENATEATVGYQGGARQVLDMLHDLVKADPTIEIHIAGHSAGAIFMAPVVQYWCSSDSTKITEGPMRGQMGLNQSVESCTLWAPAIRVDKFLESFGPVRRSGKIKRMSMFALSDKTERDDNCLGVYHKSLLYLVSRSFEHDGNAAILGMQRYVEADNRVKSLFGPSIVYTPTGALPHYGPGVKVTDSSSGATHHGDFDDDPATLWSTLARIDNVKSIVI